MTPLDAEHLTQTIDYYRYLMAQAAAKVKSLAVKMGVDPDVDMVIVPARICGRGELPRWMMGSTQRKIEHIKGARRK